MKDIVNKDTMSNTFRSEILRLLREAVDECESARQLLGVAQQHLDASRRRIEELLDKIHQELTR